MDIRKSALVSRARGAMFDLIEAAEHYPQFMPWCSHASILERSAQLVVARLTVDYHGARFDFTTRNPMQRPEWMAITLVDGPFERFEGEWRLTELAPEACRIDFGLSYEFGGRLIGRLAAPVFEGIANTMVDAFVRRADTLP